MLRKGRLHKAAAAAGRLTANRRPFEDSESDRMDSYRDLCDHVSIRSSFTLGDNQLAGVDGLLDDI